MKPGEELALSMRAYAAIESGAPVYVSVSTVASLKFTERGRQMMLEVLSERMAELRQLIQTESSND